MFNSSYKKEAISNLKKQINKYNQVYESTNHNIIELYYNRLNSIEIIKKVEKFINSLANSPKEFEKFLSEIKINYHEFEKEAYDIECESKNADKVSGGVSGVGAAAGVGVAAFGPTAAMAIATTFGTASTGTAIATLSGAAATNAALAWLGGGVLAVGGGGMVAGEAFLALAGPVGWTIGGAALLGGGLLASSKNRKIAEKAERQTRDVKIGTNNLLKIQEKVKSISNQTMEMLECLSTSIKKIIRYGITDYFWFNDEQKDQLKTIINVTNSLSEKLSEKIN